MKGEYLGEFEELCLMTCLFLKEEAYGINIVETIFKQMGRKVRLGAVHMTLYRLEDKGLVSSEMTGATATRGGRRKRVFKLTNTGLTLLRNTQARRNAFYQQIPELKSY